MSGKPLDAEAPFDAEAHVAHMARVMELPIDPEWQPSVVATLAATARIALLVLDRPVDGRHVIEQRRGREAALVCAHRLGFWGAAKVGQESLERRDHAITLRGARPARQVAATRESVRVAAAWPSPKTQTPARGPAPYPTM